MTEHIPTARERAFFEAMVRHEIDNASGPEFVAWAMMGFTLRQHARVAHAGENARSAELGEPKDDPHRAWWRFGYDFDGVPTHG